MPARLRITLDEFDAVDDRQFEYALRDLLIRDGFDARQVGRAGDQGAGVIAEHSRLGRLVDRDRLGQWAHDGVPLHHLLRLPARRGD
ncbi:hypothetical protein GCM10014715_64240 [Streptomyces spiralis]|uniref:Restriction endonuclease type IV Mrr domain-containing protein n=1 Tax=Streptomyces spiralis TaxID=66376 RepID=A0A919ACL5_9ACTN|nr:restriction endonuclease [Streptomyces spiralis]GHE99177.1 hypothetical protein GCM10014715_64240 [Streptomyces spiralis]